MAASRPRSYIEYPVCEQLRSSVDCLWSSGPARAPRGIEYPIFPDGCVDIVFRFCRRPGSSHALAEATVVGPMTRAVWLAQDPLVDWIGVRFRPGHGYRYLGVPLNALVDVTPSVFEVLDVSVAGRLRGIGALGSMEERLAALEQAVLCLDSGTRSVPSIVVDAANAIKGLGGEQRIETLCSDIGISRQHLSREFARHVGLSPKRLSRIVRFKRVLRHVRRSSAPDYADLAAELGYYDQAHLIADFSQFAGKSPERYRRHMGRAALARLPLPPGSGLQCSQPDSLEAGMRR